MISRAIIFEIFFCKKFIELISGPRNRMLFGLDTRNDIRILYATKIILVRKNRNFIFFGDLLKMCAIFGTFTWKYHKITKNLQYPHSKSQKFQNTIEKIKFQFFFRAKIIFVAYRILMPLRVPNPKSIRFLGPDINSINFIQKNIFENYRSAA